MSAFGTIGRRFVYTLPRDWQFKLHLGFEWSKSGQDHAKYLGLALHVEPCPCEYPLELEVVVVLHTARQHGVDSYDVFDATPVAASLIESLRDVGYTLETALADVIDNSVSAGAKQVDILAEFDSGQARLAIVDDGHGMSEKELRAAMRPGSTNPNDARPETDLGRFGLGLKTASFSQCRRLTVATRRSGNVSAACWDLDHVAKTNRWEVLVRKPVEIAYIDQLQGDGTLVLWEEIDRLGTSLSQEEASRHFTRQLDQAADHLGLVFHRFLSDPKNKRVSIRLNGRPIDAFDPFHESHPATVRGPEEVLVLGGDEMRMRAFTLPHHSKVSKSDWNKYAGPRGYLRGQGFYVYRQRRLIVQGTWFGLATHSELTKLARVRIDLPNTMDDLWHINVLKAHARPPNAVRKSLKSLVERMGSGSVRVYQTRGVSQVAEARLPVWQRETLRDGFAYRINKDHPAIQALLGEVPDESKSRLEGVLNMISEGLPYDALFSDFAGSPSEFRPPSMSEQELVQLAQDTFQQLWRRGRARDDCLNMMRVSEPFKSHWPTVKRILYDDWE